MHASGHEVERYPYDEEPDTDDGYEDDDTDHEYDEEPDDDEESEDEDRHDPDESSHHWRKPMFGPREYVSRTERELAERREQYRRAEEDRVLRKAEEQRKADEQRLRDSFKPVVVTAEQLAPHLDPGERPPLQRNLDNNPGDLHAALNEARWERTGRYDREVLALYYWEVQRRLSELPSDPTYSELRAARAVVFDFHRSAKNGLPCRVFRMGVNRHGKQIKIAQWSLHNFSCVRALHESEAFKRYQHALKLARQRDYASTPKGQEVAARKRAEHTRLERIRVARVYLLKLAAQVADARRASDTRAEAKLLAKAEKRIAKIIKNGGGETAALRKLFALEVERADYPKSQEQPSRRANTPCTPR